MPLAVIKTSFFHTSCPWLMVYGLWLMAYGLWLMAYAKIFLKAKAGCTKGHAFPLPLPFQQNTLGGESRPKTQH